MAVVSAAAVDARRDPGALGVEGHVLAGDAGREALPPEVRRLTGQELVDIWTAYVTSLTTGPETLLHGDLHIDNTNVLPDGEVGFLDWQVLCRGNWTHDVGYWIQSALTETDRRRHEEDLLGEYLAFLEVRVEDRPSIDEARLRYRASAAHGLPVWLITLLGNVHPHDRSLALVQRFAAPFAELETAAAVANLGA